MSDVEVCENTESPSASIVLKRQLGGGSQGSVFVAESSEYPQVEFAVKIFLRRTNGTADIGELKAYERLGSRCRYILRVGHPFQPFGRCDFSRLSKQQVEKLHGCQIALPMELCRGDLLTALRHGGKFSEGYTQKCMMQILEVVAFAHSRGVAHGDLKPGNILFAATGDVRVADWGASTITAVGSERALTNCIAGTDQYVAPEIFTQYRPGGCEVAPQYMWDAFDADTWSLGMVLFAMLSGTLPFHKASLGDAYFVAFLQTTNQEDDMIRLVQEIVSINNRYGATEMGGIEEIREAFIAARSHNVEFAWPSSWSNDLINLITRMLCVDPDYRLTSGVV
eukprot:gb/GECG01007154.1/.p1 GENE.gb/GECG01007154.1/~~gb/GECG01007154.1/.p1  ORF type:complete len:338 (+),score=33.17 gb/GECG01007154.1/:1-1014(+)